MSVIFGDKQTAWDGDSLARLQARLCAPLPFSLCRHCGTLRKFRTGRKGCYVGGKGFCGPCYGRWRLAGYPETGVPPLLTSEERSRLAREIADLRSLELVAPQRPRATVRSGDYGYRPSTGTGRAA